MNKTELIVQVSEKTLLNKNDVTAVVAATLNTIMSVLANGEKVQLVGFGTFEVRQRAERLAKNPRTGESVKIAASKVPVFKPGSSLKEKVNN